MLLGHAHPAVTEAISKQAERGTSFGATTELEVELATLITSAIPFIEKIRFVSSGTEATMSALRLARGVTKRDLLLKFEGNYHGHSDSFLSQSGSGLATLSIAECPGVPQALAALTLNAPYNDLNAVEKLFAQHHNKIAAIIVEPVAANMGVVLPEPGFLAGLREISRKNGALLIVDEVITGFVCITALRSSDGNRGGPDDIWQNYRRGRAGCGVRRPSGTDEQCCSSRSGISGWNISGESLSNERRNCDAETIGSTWFLRSN